MFEFKYHISVYNDKKRKITKKIFTTFFNYEAAEEYIRVHEHELKKHERFVIEDEPNEEARK